MPEFPIFDAVRDVCTQGTYMGEEGTGYHWDIRQSYGDYSAATRGHIQGYTEPCKIRVQVLSAKLSQSEGGELLLYLPEGIYDKDGYPLDPEWGLRPSEAIAYGIAEVVED